MSGYTPGNDNKYEHIWLVVDATELWIRIKAASDARIALSEVPHVTISNTYEIFIDNGGCEIRRFVT